MTMKHGGAHSRVRGRRGRQHVHGPLVGIVQSSSTRSCEQPSDASGGSVGDDGCAEHSAEDVAGVR